MTICGADFSRLWHQKIKYLECFFTKVECIGVVETLRGDIFILRPQANAPTSPNDGQDEITLAKRAKKLWILLRHHHHGHATNLVGLVDCCGEETRLQKKKEHCNRHQMWTTQQNWSKKQTFKNKVLACYDAQNTVDQLQKVTDTTKEQSRKGSQGAAPS